MFCRQPAVACSHQIFAAPFLSNHAQDRKKTFAVYSGGFVTSSELDGKYYFLARNHFKVLKLYFVDKDICSH